MSAVSPARKAREQARRKAWRAANPDKAREYSAKYRARHSNEELARVLAWRAANPDKVRAAYARYRAANPDKVRAAEARYRAANPDKVQASHQAGRSAVIKAYVAGLLRIPVSGLPDALYEAKRYQILIHRFINQGEAHE